MASGKAVDAVYKVRIPAAAAKLGPRRRCRRDARETVGEPVARRVRSPAPGGKTARPALDDRAARRGVFGDDGPPRFGARRARGELHAGAARGRGADAGRGRRREVPLPPRGRREGRGGLPSRAPPPGRIGRGGARDGLRLLAGGLRGELRLLRHGAARRGPEPHRRRDPRPARTRLDGLHARRGGLSLRAGGGRHRGPAAHGSGPFRRHPRRARHPDG